jgi:hypothetical protein
LRATWTTGEGLLEAYRGTEEYTDSIADVVPEVAARLKSRAEEAAALRECLEVTERAQSTLPSRPAPSITGGSSKRSDGGGKTSAASCRRSGRREKPS